MKNKYKFFIKHKELFSVIFWVALSYSLEQLKEYLQRKTNKNYYKEISCKRRKNVTIDK